MPSLITITFCATLHKLDHMHVSWLNIVFFSTLAYIYEQQIEYQNYTPTNLHVRLHTCYMHTYLYKHMVTVFLLLNCEFQNIHLTNTYCWQSCCYLPLSNACFIMSAVQNVIPSFFVGTNTQIQ